MNPTQRNELVIIDDDEVSSFYNSILAKKLGCFSVIKMFNSAESGLQLLQEKKAANNSFNGALIIDIEMPSMNGLELLDEIHDQNLVTPSTKILILTAHRSVKNFEKTQSSPLNSKFAIKPLQEEELLTLMDF